MRVKKKPIEVEAVRYEHMQREPESLNPVPKFSEDLPWLRAAVNKTVVPAGMFSDHITIKTLEGDMTCCPGDYIVKGVDDELYPVARSIFERSYEVVP